MFLSLGLYLMIIKTCVDFFWQNKKKLASLKIIEYARATTILPSGAVYHSPSLPLPFMVNTILATTISCLNKFMVEKSKLDL